MASNPEAVASLEPNSIIKQLLHEVSALQTSMAMLRQNNLSLVEQNKDFEARLSTLEGSTKNHSVSSANNNINSNNSGLNHSPNSAHNGTSSSNFSNNSTSGSEDKLSNSPNSVKVEAQSLSNNRGSSSPGNDSGFQKDSCPPPMIGSRTNLNAPTSTNINVSTANLPANQNSQIFLPKSNLSQNVIQKLLTQMMILDLQLQLVSLMMVRDMIHQVEVIHNE